MFENMRDQMDLHECLFEINVNGAIQRHAMQAPRFMIEQQFMEMVEQASRDSRPVYLKLSRPVIVWDSIDKKMIQREHSIEVKNRAYLEMENS